MGELFIDLAPLKDVLSYLQLRKVVDLEGIDVDGLFAMDADRNGQVLQSEYPSARADEFTLVREKVKDIGHELEARKQGLLYPSETSLKNCGAVLQALDEHRASLPVNAIFYCRDEMLAKAAKAILVSGKYKVEETDSPRRTLPNDLVDVISKIPSDERADVIIAMMENNFWHAILLIKYAAEADKFRLYSLAYSRTSDMTQKCDILWESQNITNETLKSTMFWTGLRDENSSIRFQALSHLPTPEAVAFGLEDDSMHVNERAIGMIPDLPVERQGELVKTELDKFIDKFIIWHNAVRVLNQDNPNLTRNNFVDILPRIKDEASRKHAFMEFLQVVYSDSQWDILRQVVLAISRLPEEEQDELIEIAVRNSKIGEVMKELDEKFRPTDSEERLIERLHTKLDELKKQDESDDGDSSVGCGISGF